MLLNISFTVDEADDVTTQKSPPPLSVAELLKIEQLVKDAEPSASRPPPCSAELNPISE
jgi:hypothetical protein